MKLKKVKIIVQSIESVKSEWSLALKGKIRSKQPEGVIIFTSLTAFEKALFPKRPKLFGVILKNNPESIYALAKFAKRDLKNVYLDVNVLSDIGFIELKQADKYDSMKPIAKYSGFKIDLAV